MLHKYFFGVFNNGQLKFKLGTGCMCTTQQAEFVVQLLETAEPPLEGGDYIAYDYLK